MRRLLLLVSLLSTLASAAVAQSYGEDVLPMAGEPVAGFPAWEERVLLQLTNRARVAPDVDLAGCVNCGPAELSGCYTPRPPLTWNANLNEAARFHSAYLARSGEFSHYTGCALAADIGARYPDACDGSPACACAGAGTTSPGSRVALFGGSYSAEIIAAGYSDPVGAFYGWLHEPAPTATCSYGGGNGHRYIILTSWGPSVGYGFQYHPSSSWGRYYTGDFGSGAAASKLVTGTHWTSSGLRQGSSIEFWASWYDGAAPSEARVIINGTPYPMTLGRGTQANGAWTTTRTGLGSGCHRYYFAFRDAGGTQYTYPSTGSFGIGTPPACADWSSQRDGATASVKGDFNGDGRADLVWRNAVTGENSFWFVNGTTVLAGGAFNPVGDVQWAVAGTGDFNGDGRSDLVWHHRLTGSVSIWLMNGAAYVSQVNLSPVTDVAWRAVASGDLDGNGSIDLVWRNGTTGANSLWLMSGTSIGGTANLPAVTDPAWHIVGGGDVNGDGKGDLILWNSTTGSVVAWFMNGATRTSQWYVGQVADVTWRVAAVGDFNGDGRADIAWENAAGGTAMWFLNGTSVLGGGFVGAVPGAWDLGGAR